LRSSCRDLGIRSPAKADDEEIVMLELVVPRDESSPRS
jgi:hypothetical protein